MPTLVEKIIAAHAGPVRAGDIVDVAIDVRVARDFGGANVVKNLQAHDMTVADPQKTFFTFDCNPTGSDQKYAANQQLCRDFARAHGIRVFDIDSGIGTHLAIDNGLIGPGGTFVSTDSHANIIGAIGAFGQGMGDLDIAHAFARGTVWFTVPATIKINLNGSLPVACSAKDVALRLLQQFGANGLLGYAAELHGQAVAHLTLSDRITIASMATEMGAIILLFPPSREIIDYCAHAGAALKPVFADPDAHYVKNVDIYITDLEPLISRPGHPEDVVPVRQVEGTSVDSVFIGSCTNGRFEDLQQAAAVLQGRQKAEHVVLKIVPATDAIWQQCLHAGLFDIFKKAGALISNAGCAGCAAGQVGQNGPGEVTVSTGNRNYTGKQGRGDVYLASPATAAASAIAGFIVSADRLDRGEGRMKSTMKTVAKTSGILTTARVVTHEPKPTLLRGRARIIPMDNIDTDMIYHNRYLSITDSREMGQYAFNNLAGWQDFAQKTQEGDILVVGHNFGCGSSRQQAVDCFKSLGIQLIMAKSFGAIYARNAINAALPILVADLSDKEVQEGDRIQVDLLTGQIRLANGATAQAAPFSDIQKQIYLRGGLL
ncbi:3-isopropylmalate dehydratase large subunit [candidate division KSB1 bacterium]|nr:MAG: 3-isopropylmalate dehydratase large subunit [candidate division KSB1 bacterium]